MRQKSCYFGLILAGLIMLVVSSYFDVPNIPAQAYSGTSDLIVAGQVLTIPVNSSANYSVNKAKSLKVILSERGITNPWNTLKIMINKSNHTLSIVYKNTWLKTYHVELGAGGLGDKEVLGDLKTPEGTFYISEKTVLSPADQYLGTRWMRLSYPNAEDAERGLREGLINAQIRDDIVSAFNAGKGTPRYTALGGGVGIHGGSTQELGKDWTWGCIGLTNNDVEDFYDFVSVGTPVIITK